MYWPCGRYYWKWVFTLPEPLSLSRFFNLIFMWLSKDSCWWVSFVSEYVMNRGFDCLCSRLVVTNLLGTRDQLHGRSFSHGPVGGGMVSG